MNFLISYPTATLSRSWTNHRGNHSKWDNFQYCSEVDRPSLILFRVYKHQSKRRHYRIQMQARKGISNNYLYTMETWKKGIYNVTSLPFGFSTFFPYFRVSFLASHLYFSNFNFLVNTHVYIYSSLDRPNNIQLPDIGHMSCGIFSGSLLQLCVLSQYRIYVKFSSNSFHSIQVDLYVPFACG